MGSEEPVEFGQREILRQVDKVVSVQEVEGRGVTEATPLIAVWLWAWGTVSEPPSLSTATAVGF